MGGGSWTTKSFARYTTASKKVSCVDDFTTASNLTAQSVYKSKRLKDSLNPKDVIRECVDSEEHPNTFPVILALDVTGSMGSASVKVAQKLNDIMTSIYDNDEIKDVEFCIMGIGDLHYDSAPVQMSQYESDVRIAEQLDDIYFEGGGGGNSYESYTAAWYAGLHSSALDCWKRDKKGVIITLGDESPNPYLPLDRMKNVFGKTAAQLTEDVITADLYKEVIEKFNVYHISINDASSSYYYHNRFHNCDKKWTDLLGKDNYKVCNLDNLSAEISTIVKDNYTGNTTIPKVSSNVGDTSGNEVSWW